MKSVSLQDLPQWSEWPGRLLGISDWKIPERTIDKIDSEYDKDKYARCLAYLEGRNGAATPEDVKHFEFGSDSDRDICVSVKNDLCAVPLQEARSMYYALLLEHLTPAIEKSQSVVELGAGYGYNLWMLRQRFKDREFSGGEYSTNATTIASRLYSEANRIIVHPFNFYDPRSYEFIGQLATPVTIFSSHAVEQIPRSAPILDGLLPYRDKIGSIFHFEPLHEIADTSLLQLLRRRYTEINDYNRDLLSVLRSKPYVKIVSIKENVYGMNPLNASSVLHWQFV